VVEYFPYSPPCTINVLKGADPINYKLFSQPGLQNAQWDSQLKRIRKHIFVHASKEQETFFFFDLERGGLTLRQLLK